MTSTKGPELTNVPSTRRWSRRLSLGPGLLREFVVFSATTLAYQGSRFVVNTAAARVLGPTAYGIWNGLALILLYGPSLHLGVLNAMNRDVPLYHGKGEEKKVESVRQTAFGVMLVSSLLAGLCLIVVSHWASFPPLVKSSIRLMGLALLIQHAYIYFQMYLTSAIRFDLMSLQQVVFALLLPAITIPLTIYSGLHGFIIGQVLTTLVISILIARLVSFRPRFRFRSQEIKRMIAVGFPIMAAGLLYEVFSTLDRWAILAYLGAEQLGYYSLAIIVSGVVRVLPRAVAQQIYPRMAKRYGETGNLKALKPLILREFILGTAVTICAVVGVSLLFPPFVRAFLPAYVSGIPAMNIVLWGLLFGAVGSGFGDFFNVVGKQMYYLGVQAVVIPIGFGINVALVKIGLGIEGVAWGTALNNLVYGGFLALIGWRVLRRAPFPVENVQPQGEADC
jgi:O-antigen/teichoic acid export membrane protein